MRETFLKNGEVVVIITVSYDSMLMKKEEEEGTRASRNMFPGSICQVAAT
jgi:hypothetical protein